MGISMLDNNMFRRIILSGTISDDQAAYFVEQVTALEMASLDEPITIYINSSGGSVTSCFAMLDCINTVSCPIITIAQGKCMSAAVLLLAAGDKRFITENSSIMIHSVSGGLYGNMSEIDILTEEIRRLQNSYIDLLAKYSGQTKQTILNDIAQDKYMTASEAVKYGLCDEVIRSRKKYNFAKKPAPTKTPTKKVSKKTKKTTKK